MEIIHLNWADAVIFCCSRVSESGRMMRLGGSTCSVEAGWRCELMVARWVYSSVSSARIGNWRIAAPVRFEYSAWKSNVEGEA